MTEIFRLRFSKLTATLWLALAAMTVQAAPQQDKEDPDRERYISELRNYKHDFLTRELDLSREQQRDFFPLYDEMEDRVMKINEGPASGCTLKLKQAGKIIKPAIKATKVSKPQMRTASLAKVCCLDI